MARALASGRVVTAQRLGHRAPAATGALLAAAEQVSFDAAMGHGSMCSSEPGGAAVPTLPISRGQFVSCLVRMPQPFRYRSGLLFDISPR